MRRCLGLVLALAGCGEDPPGVDAPPGPWRAGTALPGPRLEPGVAAVGDRLVVIGGFDAQIQITRDAYQLDPVADAWMSLPLAPVAWTHLGLAGRAGSVFLLGGLEGTGFLARGEAWVLGPGAPAWQPLPPMPVPRGAAGIAVGPSAIYVVGGSTATAAVASVLAYDVGQATWTALPDLPEPRSHPATFALADGTLIVTGGLAANDSTQPRADTWLWHPGDPAWTPRAPMPTARGGCASGAIGIRMICAGGEAGTAALAVVEAYVVTDDAWETLDPMPEPRSGTQGAVIGGSLYVPGGARQLAFIPEGSVYIYTP